MNGQRLRVAVVDDDESVRRGLRRLLLSLECEPIMFDSGEAFLDGLEEARAAWALLDQTMPGLRGLEVLARMRARRSRPRVLIATALPRPGLEAECLAAGAAGFLLKPISFDALARALDLPAERSGLDGGALD